MVLATRVRRWVPLAVQAAVTATGCALVLGVALCLAGLAAVSRRDLVAG